MLATYPLSKKITNQFHEAVFSFTVRGIAMNLTLVFKGTCVGITGLPPEESETATPFVGYRFSHQGFRIYQEGTTGFGSWRSVLATR